MRINVFCILIFCCVFFCYGNHIHFKHINVKDGLSQITVLSIYQDEVGTLWFGSSEGLNRYNGDKIDIYRPSQNDNGLTHNEISAICGDKSGSIYIRSIYDLIKFDIEKEKFTCILPNAAHTMYCYKDTLWLGYRNELQYYLKSDGKIHHAATLDNKFSIGNSLIIDKDYIWMGHKQGVSLISRKDYKTIKTITGISHVSSIYRDSRGNIWAGTVQDGLYRISPQEEITHYTDSNRLSNNQIRTVQEDNNGHIWVGTFNGLNHYNPNSDTWSAHLHQDNIDYGLSHNSINCLYKDQQGTIWIGTYFGGVNYFNPDTNTCRFYGSGATGNHFLSFPFVGKMVEDRTGNLWICTEGGGLNLFNRTTRTFEKFSYHANGLPGTAHNNMKCIYYAKERNKLYIGTHTGGLAVFDITRKQFRTLIPSQNNPTSQAGNIVNEIQPYKDKLIILTQAGVYLFNPEQETFSPLTHNEDINKLLFRPYQFETFLIDSKERLWLADSKGGLLCIHMTDNSLHRYYTNAQDSSSIGKFRIVDIMENSKGEIYFGTIGSGLFKYIPDNDSFCQYGLGNNALPSDYCYYICESPIYRHLLILHSKGFSLFDPETGKSKHTYNLFQMGYCQGSSIYFAQNGETFIGGVNGMLSFFEEQLYHSNNNYHIYFDQLWVHNTRVLPDDETGILSQTLSQVKEIKLSHDQNNLIFEFCSSNYTLNEDIIYEYKLEGFSDHWIPTHSQSISYTNLSPGMYRLTVREHQGTHSISLNIYIAPPFYATYWAFMIYILCVIGIMYLIIYIKTKQTQLQTSLQFERKEKERTEELNQVKLRFFTNISHEFRTPLTLIIGQIEVLLQSNKLAPTIYNRILHIYKNAWHMRDLISELLDFRKQEQGYLKLKIEHKDIVPFIKEIYMSFYEYAATQQINYRFECPEQELKLWFDPVQLQKVIFNLISNAFKYTPKGGKINVSISSTNTQAHISIKDNGSGIPQEAVNKIFERFYQLENGANKFTLGTGIGLALSKGIIDLHHGNIHVKSEPEQGSEFIIDLLKGNSHFSPEDIAHTRLTTDDSRDINKPLDLTEMPVEEVLPVVPDTDSGKPVLLIVEDNKEMLDLLKSIFESMYEVHIAQNGKEGLQMAYQVHPSLIISDVMMPEMSGKELCYKIKNSIELSYIPVILLTAQVSEQYTIEGYMFGADDYIIKPFNVKILIARCSNLIKTRQQMLERLKQPIANKQEAPDTININDRQLLEKATQIIKENFENPEFDMNLLASELGMGRSKLYTKLKEITGLTPNKFTLKLKLEEAMHLLNNAPHLNVTEISYQLGFSSARYFSKCFKTFYGIAPLNVRKNANPSAKEE